MVKCCYLQHVKRVLVLLWSARSSERVKFAIIFLTVWKEDIQNIRLIATSVGNVEILDLDVHGLALTLIGHGLIGTEEFVNLSLSWWLTESHALAGIVVGKWPHREVLPCQVPEGRKCWRWQEERPVCVVLLVEREDVHEIGLQVGVTEGFRQATDVANPVFVLGWVGCG